jgi:hypothetical protein
MLRVIPGFRGYLEKGYRREADAMVRDAIAERLQRAKPGLDGYAHQLLDGGHIDALPLVDRARVALDSAIGQVKGQVRGYSGFFDFVKVTEQTLDAVYEFDLRMVDDAEQLAAAVEQLAVKGDTPVVAMSDLQRRIAEFQRQFEGRAEILRGMTDGV